METCTLFTDKFDGALRFLLDLVARHFPNFVFDLVEALFIARELCWFVIISKVKLFVLMAAFFQPLHLLMSIEVHISEYIEYAHLVCQFQIIHQIVLELFLEAIDADSALASEVVGA